MKKDKRLSQAKELKVGGMPTDSTARLYIYVDDIDIPAISDLLHCEPTEAHRKGDVIKKRPPASIGLWCLEAPGNLSFPDKLSYLTETTTSNHGIWDKLASTHRLQLRCAVFLHSWTEGFDIPAEVIAEIGNRHWEYLFSMYSAEGEEILDAFLKGKNKA
jgi:hypothetical protein